VRLVTDCRAGQVVATVVAGTVQLGVQSWMFTNIPNICSTTQKDGFICPNTEVFGTASFIWGVIGPQRQFSSGQVYHGAYSMNTLRFMCTYSARSACIFLPYWRLLPVCRMVDHFEVAKRLHPLRQVRLHFLHP
jgi:hypothetical protein